MLKTVNLGLRFNTRTLFSDVNLEFKDDNCYGIIGANGAGKSTFLKLLSGEIDSTSGEVILGKNERLSVLKQNHNEFNDLTVLETVIMGNSKLYKIMKEKDALYSKEDFTMEDGMKVAELEEEFGRLNGYQAESDAAVLLLGLGIKEDLLYKKMGELKESIKVKVLLASALFGEPDILLLDEPTNGLDAKSIMWLEEFLINFKNTVLVVSHDRHFLNKVCTHMLDIDYEKITLFVGNYDFWYQSSNLIKEQLKQENKKKEEKIKELQEFIARFSANASKSKQATSRKKLLDKIVLDDIKASSRKYPYINFKEEKSLGRDVLTTKNLCVSVDGIKLINNLNLTINNYDKIAFIGNEIIITTLFKVLSGEIKPDSGEVIWGNTVLLSYFPHNNDNYFKSSKNIVEWLMSYSNVDDVEYVRGFLGRMLFSGEDALKKVDVLSGGEKVRCMLSKMMLSGANTLILDQPTDHLDVETITSLNNALINFKGVVLFSTHDHELMETVANRIIDIKADKVVDREVTYNEYLGIE